MSPGANESTKLGYLNAYSVFNFSENNEIRVNGYVDHRIHDLFYILFPAGAIPSPHPLSQWNDAGFISNLKWKESKVGSEVLLTNKSLPSQTIVAGLSIEHQRQHDVRHFANHNPGFLPTVKDVSNGFNFNRNVTRKLLGIYMEDIWDARDNIRVSCGFRFDQYNDFGGSFNSRMGL